MKTKMKTNKGAAKRFRRKGNGAVKCRHANRNHILTKKAQKRKRHLRAAGAVKACDMHSVDNMLRD